jgi:hypothetical protein
VSYRGRCERDEVGALVENASVMSRWRGPLTSRRATAVRGGSYIKRDAVGEDGRDAPPQNSQLDFIEQIPPERWATSQVGSIDAPCRPE